MVIVLSPAKSLDWSDPDFKDNFTSPKFMDESQKLIDILRKKSKGQIKKLMDLSDDLTNLNYQRYQDYNPPFNIRNSKQALLAFRGDVYRGMDVNSLNTKQLNYTQEHIRILSGLFGLLKPLDLIQPYRLEMGTKLKNGRNKNLYEFWGDKIAIAINEALENKKHKTLINLASTEYFKSIKTDKINGNIITPIFKDFKNGQYKVLMTYAKLARGMMSRFAIDNKISDPQELKGFTTEGYIYQPDMSNNTEWVFTRGG